MTTYDVLVPAKPWSAAKTRLSIPRGVDRRALAAGFARDVVNAASAAAKVAQVHLVTTEPTVDWSARTIADRGNGDLNTAVREAAYTVDSGRGIVVLTADLPCLRAEDLDAALAFDDGERWFVADHHGTGTTLLAAAPGVPLGPCFGPGSAAKHAASGAHAIGGALRSLRLDVDTAVDLDAARRLGLGSYTAAALTSRTHR